MKKLAIIFCSVLIFTMLSCKKDKPIPPVLTTTVPDRIYATTATSGGNILSEGSSTVMRRGVCYGTMNTPTITNDTTFNGIGAGKFESHLKKLNYNSTYFVRAYAINAEGVGYGDAMSFKTPMAKVPVVLGSTTLTDVTATSATTDIFNATSEIGVPILSKGVCWYLVKDLVQNTQNPLYTGYTCRSPTVLDNKSEGVAAILFGIDRGFTATMTGLTENTLYDYTMYATNAVGTSYGGGTTFMTPPLVTPTVHIKHPSSTSSGVYGSTSTGLQSAVTVDYSTKVISSYGAVFSTSPHPSFTTQNTWTTVVYSGTPPNHFYMVSFQGLLVPNVINYIRAFVRYTDSTFAYSNEEWSY